MFLLAIDRARLILTSTCLICLSAAVVCVATSNTFAQVLSDSLRSWDHPVRSVMAMPAQVKLVTSRIHRGRDMTAEESKTTALLYSAVLSELELRQVKAVPARGDQAEISAIWNDYARIAPQLQKKPGGIAKGEYTIGNRLARLPPSELTLFIDGSGFLPTGGKAARAATEGIGGWTPVFHGYLTFVDPQTGKAVAFCRFTFNGDPSSERSISKMRQQIRESMRDLPFSLPADTTQTK